MAKDVKKQPDAKKGFVHLRKAWYAESTLKYKPADFVDDICLYVDGAAEMVIEWIRLDGKSTPLLRAFDDAWGAFALCPKFFADLATLRKENVLSNDIRPLDIINLLKRHGFKDETPVTAKEAQ